MFVGRLAPEKGTGTMLAAWDRLAKGIPLKIVGDGPLKDQVVRAAAGRSNVEWLGHRPLADVHALMRKADVLVFPSYRSNLLVSQSTDGLHPPRETGESL